MAVSGGYIQVHEDMVIILADNAVSASQIDVEEARRTKERAQERLKEIGHAGDEVDGLALDLDWAEAHLRVGGSHAQV